jgi:hypothetical protein
MKEISKGLKTLRIFANKFGRKITSVEGIKIIEPDGNMFVYKQSSEDLPIGSERPDWTEDLSGNIILNPIQIRTMNLSYNIKAVVNKEYYDLTLDDSEYPTTERNLELLS